MNPWFTFLVTGLAFALDNFVTLITDRGNNPVTLSAKQRRIMNIVRGVSGLVIMGFAWLTIAKGWNQSGLKVTLASVQEGMAYAFAVAGAFRVLTYTVIALGSLFLDSKMAFNSELNKVWLGAYMFILGGLALVWIDRDTSPVLVPALVFICALFIIVAIHYFSTRPNKSILSPSTSTKL